MCLTLLIGLGAVFAYERATSAYRLGKLQKEVAIVKELEALKSAAPPDSSTLKLCNAIESQLNEVVLPQSVFPSSRREWVWKFCAGAAPWILLEAMMIYWARRDSSWKKGKMALFGLGIGSVFGGIGVTIPTINWPYFNLVYYPILTVLLTPVILICFTLRGAIVKE